MDRIYSLSVPLAQLFRGRVLGIGEGLQSSLPWRAYRTFGSRTVYVYAALAAVGVFVAVLVGVVILAAYLRMSSGQELTYLAVSEAAAMTVLGITVVLSREDIRAILAWQGKPRDAAHATEMWKIVAAGPRSAARRGGPLAAVATVGLGVFVVAYVGEPWWALFPVIAGAELELAGALALCVFVGELLGRPLLEEAAAALPADFEPDARVASVRANALAPLALITMAAALIVGAFPAASHSGAVRLLIVFAIALPTVAAATLMFFIVFRSLLDPIGDLTAATRRVSRGDLSTPIPLVSADELGELAASFNTMLEGLREREALREEVLLREDQLRASRARIVAASDAERRRVERNIHDGAQQQLVALAVKLRMLEERLDDEDARAAISTIGERLKTALDELRELARGLHPSVLTTDGLAPALEQLASRAPIPVTLTATDERFSEAVESTAYFVASEALANVAKYAQAEHAELSVERRDSYLVVRIIDDGIGGADAEGSGLLGLLDRVAALDGQLTITSPAGVGTTITAELPLA